jgi:predicted secreted protein
MALSPKVGRTLLVSWGGVLPANQLKGVREKSLQLNGDAINITSDDDNGWRALLDVGAEDQVTINVSGVTKDEVLKADWFGGTRTKAMQVKYANGAIIAGTFFLQSFTDTGPYNDAVTFQATFISTGIVTFTAGT